jgi:hypothetical protein
MPESLRRAIIKGTEKYSSSGAWESSQIMINGRKGEKLTLHSVLHERPSFGHRTHGYINKKLTDDLEMVCETLVRAHAVLHR